MKEKDFVNRREPVWNEFSLLITGRNKKLKTTAVPFIRYFREITQDLNTARSCGFDPAIIERLNTLVNEGNQILYSQHGWSIKAPVFFILHTFPQKIRSQWKGILAAALLFYTVALFFGFLCVRFPDISGEIISPRELAGYKEMYNPESEAYLSPRNVTGDADMFGFYIYNNVTNAFRTFAGGIFAGIGSLFILLVNAGHLGIIGGYLINSGFSKTFFPFIIAHSSFELTAVIFSAHAGLLLGYRFFITEGLSRGDSLKKAGKDAFPIIAGSAVMLFIAAIIEAFWSSRFEFPLTLRIGAGIGLWAGLAVYFLTAGRKSTTGIKNESAG